ncbi:cation diffusion facilitator family transporter [Methanobrevibacter sp. DSM 116169]|uniref:cation diffusion facilitator family transporter n=1 Tax=Methanobrevibacter sp. DSM 116169 TaxID=3242727 RepID=UPI0038FD044F
MIKRFFPSFFNKKNLSRNERTRMITFAAIMGIAANIIFSISKIIIGIISNSISIISDGVNNLIDVSSSIITILGLKLSQLPPDHDHPLGYGRIEYLSGMVISAIILFTGFEFLRISIGRIINPEYTYFLTFQIIILIIMIIGKWALAIFTKFMGERTQSEALIASAADAKVDVLTSTLVVLSAIVSKYTGWYIDGYVGIILSIFICYTGLSLIKDTISSLIGKRPNKKLTETLKKEVLKFEPIIGAYDLIAHDYGPTTKLASINVELPDYVTVEEAYGAMDAAQHYIWDNYNIHVVFGLHSVNTYDKNVVERREYVKYIIKDFPGAISIHNFSYNKSNQLFRFDVVVDFSVNDFYMFKKNLTEIIKEKYPNAETEIDINLDYS